MSRQVEPMSLEELRRLLDAHGADEVRWPQDVRARAQALLASDMQAQALLEEARALDDLLSASAAPPADEGLERRILAAAGISTAGQGAAAQDAPAAANDNAPAPWWVAVPVAASLLLGVLLGFSGALQPVQQVLLAQVDDPLLEAVMPVEDDEGGLL